MGARIYNPRFEASEVSHVSTHLLKLTLTRLVEQDKRYQLGSSTASERSPSRRWRGTSRP